MAIDEGKAAQLAATFGITIFLSLILLVSSQQPFGHGFLDKVLWFSSGFFSLSSMKLLDKIFDQDHELEVMVSLLSVGNRNFIQIDSRFTDLAFAFYFFGWISFLIAYFGVGAFVFLDVVPNSLSELSGAVYSDTTLLVAFLAMLFITFSSVTREFLFIN